MSGSMAALLRKEWREARWRLVIAVLLLAGTGASLGPLFDVLGDYMGLLGQLQLPGWIMDTMAHQMANYLVYLWSNWYGKNLLQLVAILAAIYGAGLIAGETARRTSAVLFSRPVGRREVLLAKYLVNLVVLAIASLAGTLAVIAGGQLSGHAVPALALLKGLPATLAGTALLLALATLLSVGSDDPTKVIGVALLALVGIFAAGSWGPLRRLSPFAHMAAGTTLQTGRVDWPAVGAMSLVALGLFVLAVAWLQRREL